MRTAFQSMLRANGATVLAGALEALAFRANHPDAGSATGPIRRRRRKLKKYLQDHQRPNRRRK